MTAARMTAIWSWLAARLADPPPAPKFKVSLFFRPLGAAGIYRNGTLICKPWASRTIVIHEACHHLWYEWRVPHTWAGIDFLMVMQQPYWNTAATESWCATLTATLEDRPAVWRQPISGVMPVKEAVWTFAPFLKDKR